MRCVVLMIDYVGRGEAESNIFVHEHNISHVGRHRVRQLFCFPYKRAQGLSLPENHKECLVSGQFLTSEALFSYMILLFDVK